MSVELEEMYRSQISNSKEYEYSFDIENQILKEMRMGLVRKDHARIEDIANDFTLVNENGDFVTLYDSLDSSPVLINFYSSLDSVDYHDIGIINNEIINQGAQHYLITPESFENHNAETLKSLVNIELLQDSNLNAFHRYGLVSNFTQEHNDTAVESRKYRLNNEFHITYLINSNRRIEFSQLNFFGEKIHKEVLIERMKQINNFIQEK